MLSTLSPSRREREADQLLLTGRFGGLVNPHELVRRVKVEFGRQVAQPTFCPDDAMSVEHERNPSEGQAKDRHKISACVIGDQSCARSGRGFATNDG
jgi:hypothetical protein